MDHFFQIEPTGLPAEANMLEGYTTLGYLAAHTSTIDLGLLVTGVTYRHPGVLAKIVTTLDVLSGGRAVLGLGAAWFEREHRALGVPFPPLAERFERLEEALQIAAQMWDPQNNGPYEGKHYQLAETLCSPQPLHRPRSDDRRRAASARRCGWSRSTATRATCSPRRPPTSSTSSTSCAATATTSAGTTPRSAKTIIANNPRPGPDTADEFVRAMADYAKLGMAQTSWSPRPPARRPPGSTGWRRP